MNFRDFYGLPEQVLRLQQDIAAGRMVHAYLFSGPKGMGKRSMAEVCARAVNCAGAQKPCDQCAMCKLYLAQSHPDHIVIRPEKSIGVEAVRALISRVSNKSFEGGVFTVIIEQADKLTIQAQNALLKTLETPPGGVVFFLLTDAPSALLSTIISRCRTVRFTPAPESQVVEALTRQGIDKERAQLLAHKAQGSIGKALALHQDEQYWKLYERTMGALARLQTRSDVADAAMMLKDDGEYAQMTLEIMEDRARELILNAHSSDTMYDVQKPGGISGDKLLLGIVQMKKKLSSNVRWQSALEMLFFTILGGN